MSEPSQRPTPPRQLARESPGQGSGLFVLGLALGLLTAILVDRGARLFLDRDVELVRSVRDLALEEFVDPVESQQLIDDALQGMLSGLDRYSHYYAADELADLDRETSGEFRGIGVVFRASEPGQVLFPYPGSPAEKSGLRVGDRILAVQGQPWNSGFPRELQALLRQAGDGLALSVEGLDGERRQLSLAPDVVLDPTVRHRRMIDEEQGIGYLAICSFSHHTPEEFDQAVQDLERQGLRGLIVDLRANPGGILDSAVKVANRFVSHGTLVVTRTRSETHVTEALAEEAHLSGLPLALLIDDRSASASEILAAALQDHCAAVLVGEASYGKGTVQTLKRIGRDRGEVKLTTAIYFSPSMRRIEHDDSDSGKGGIAPDLWLPLSPEEKRAVHLFLVTYSPPASALPALKDWEAREHVELIQGPPPDRQLDAAVALLSGGELDLHADPLR